jgi:hypothetical protein
MRDWRYYVEQLHNLYFRLILLGDRIKEEEIEGSVSYMGK